MKIRSIDQMPPITGISLICLWLILWGCVTLTRPLLPIDETRCVSVAWEMWQSGNFLVPHLNGIPYSHKPPLLCWLILSGWKLFGVNEWWPRLLPPLFGLGCLFLTSGRTSLISHRGHRIFSWDVFCGHYLPPWSCTTCWSYFLSLSASYACTTPPGEEAAIGSGLPQALLWGWVSCRKVPSH